MSIPSLVILLQYLEEYPPSRFNVEIHPSYIDKCHDFFFSSTLYSVNLLQRDCQYLQERSTIMVLYVSYIPSRCLSRAHWTSFTLHSSRIDGCFSSSHVGTLLQDLSCTSCDDECTSSFHIFPLQLKVQS